MTINRDFLLQPVIDFMRNIKPNLRDNLVATEVYNGNELTVWIIEPLHKTKQFSKY